MILTTTPTIEWKHITSYHGVISGEVISGINLLNNI